MGKTKGNITENTVLGIIGAFLFSLAGGILWFALARMGMIASISGFVGVYFAIRGYEIFAKKQSVKGIVISVAVAAAVLFAAWYLSFAADLYEAEKIWFENGEISQAMNYPECIRYGYSILIDDSDIMAEYVLKGLLPGLLFAAVGCGATVVARIKSVKTPKVYPVTPTDTVCGDYEMKINGKNIALNTARVSAFPMNRRWPGHQREISQTELINFASFAMNSPVEIEITPKDEFGEVAIRPKSLGIVPEISDGKIKFTLPHPAYFTVEPFGRNRALCVFADPVKKYAAGKGENVIYFGKGEHDAGLITLHDNDTLFIDEGAVVYASVWASDAKNIKIIGNGILDNSKNREEILFAANEKGNTAAVNNANRRHTVQLEYCTGILIDGVTMRDSLVYNIRPIGCRDLVIKNVKIIGCWRYNSDGIDMHNCENVDISNCFIRTFDDSICIKGFDCYTAENVDEAVKKMMYHNGTAYDVFRNVRIKDCVIWNDWGKCLEIGAETKAKEITDIVFSDCRIIHAQGPVLDCMNVDNADVHGVIYRDITVEFDDVMKPGVIQQADGEEYVNNNPDYCPKLIYVSVKYHPEYSKGSPERGKNRDLRFENIRVYGKHFPTLRFSGFDAEHKTENITVDGIYLNDEKITEFDAEHLLVEDFADGIGII